VSERSLLQLGAGPMMVRSIQLLRAAGWRVFTVDRDPHAPGFAFADGSAAIDIADVEGIVRYASEIRADVILPVNDPGVLAAAEAAPRLGLRCVPLEVARRSVDKGLMRDCWAAAGLPQPRYQVVDDPGRIPAAAGEIGFPLVLKPALNWGSRGVSFVADPSALPWAIDFAHAHCRNGRYVVEAAIPGTEMTIEGLVQAGRPQVLAKSDKVPQPHPRYRVATALNYPARFSAEQLRRADEVVARAALALGIRDGAFHCECMLNERGVFLLEMAARPGGGHIFGQIVEAVSGVSMPLALASILLGEPVALTPRFQRGACYRFFAPPPGIFRAVRGLDEACRLPGVLDFGFSLEPGRVVGPVASDADRPGFVVTRGETREEAMAVADRAIARLEFVMDPLPTPAQAR